MLVREPDPERLGLPSEGSEAGAAPEHLIDLPHEGPGPGQVGERKVDADELDPGLNGKWGSA